MISIQPNIFFMNINRLSLFCIPPDAVCPGEQGWDFFCFLKYTIFFCRREYRFLDSVGKTAKTSTVCNRKILVIMIEFKMYLEGKDSPKISTNAVSVFHINMIQNQGDTYV